MHREITVHYFIRTVLRGAEHKRARVVGDEVDARIGLVKQRELAGLERLATCV
ncbi:hypothetical protein GCM10027093_26470 [Paraburkholderia jirisanensis]